MTTPPRSFSRRAAAVALALTVALHAGVARADPARAREHFEKGKRYFQVDEYRKAIEEFKAAHIEEPDPAFLYNIAECHRRVGENKEALTFYRRYLTHAPPNAPSRPVVEKRIAEIEAATPRPAPAPPPVPTEAPPARRAEPLPPAAPPPRPAPAAVAPLAPAPEAAIAAAPAEPPRPFYKRGWFYVALGAVVVGAAAGAWALSADRTEIPASKLGNTPAF